MLATALGAGAAAAQTAAPPDRQLELAQAVRPPTASAAGELAAVSKINEWTIGVSGGPLESTLLRFAAELGMALNEEDRLRVLPIVSAGSIGNINDLLYLRGVDLAMVGSDALDELKRSGKVANIERRINFLFPVYVVELNILARPEIKSLKDLEGKKVGFHVRGAAPTITGRILFERLGVKVEPVFVNNSVAYERMKTGEIAALLHPGGKPNDFLLNLKLEPGFHLLPVEFSNKFEDYYVPSELTHEDYPKLIERGRKIETLGLVAVLAVYNWPQGSDRHRRVERFIEQLLLRFAALTKPPYHPKWREVNLESKLPGWNRYWAFDQALARMRATAEKEGRSIVTHSTPGDVARQERMFQEFLASQRQQAR